MMRQQICAHEINPSHCILRAMGKRFCLTQEYFGANVRSVRCESLSVSSDTYARTKSLVTLLHGKHSNNVSCVSEYSAIHALPLAGVCFKKLGYALAHSDVKRGNHWAQQWINSYDRLKRFSSQPKNPPRLCGGSKANFCLRVTKPRISTRA